VQIDWRNTNSLWASVLVETLVRSGLTTAIVCPGSRSTPLTLAFAQHPNVDAIPILDERSAAFFALGRAKRTGRAVALVCTSGTAGANFFPAVIEAYESRVPLLVLTADRPPELRDCNSGQTIDQLRLFGHYPNWQTELNLPSRDRTLLNHLRQVVAAAWSHCYLPTAGAVHLNCPFRDPLAPIAETGEPIHLPSDTFDHFFDRLEPLHQDILDAQARESPTDALVQWWRSRLQPGVQALDAAQFTPEPYRADAPTPAITAGLSADRAANLSADLAIESPSLTNRGIIIAGVTTSRHPEAYCQAVWQIAAALGWVILAEGLSPLRNFCSAAQIATSTADLPAASPLDPHLNRQLDYPATQKFAADTVPIVATYDLLLRHPAQAIALRPDFVLQLGSLPTSKVLRQWLTDHDPERWILDAGDRNLDPLHGRSQRLRGTIEQLAAALQHLTNSPRSQNHPADAEPFTSSHMATGTTSRYLKLWQEADQQVRSALAKQFDANLLSKNFNSAQDLDLKNPALNNSGSDPVTSNPPILNQLIEPQIAYALPQILPPKTPIFIANSMPVRDVEWFWQLNDRQIQPWFNRGANGIDGTLSTAIGIAHRQQPAVLLTGDLALLHDTNGFLLHSKFVGSLTIILLDNHGGGIFEMLPIAQFNPPFEEFFATPQMVNIAALCAAYGVEYLPISSLDNLRQICEKLPEMGMRLCHVQCDRKHDSQWRKRVLNQLGQVQFSA